MIIKSLLFSLSVLLFSSTLLGQAQTTFTSTCGYTVTVTLTPIQIVLPSSANCPWGYNYNLKYNYQVVVNGTIPSGWCGGAPGGSLNTLQVEFNCLGTNSGGYNLPLTGGSGTLTTTTNQYVPNNGTEGNYSLPYVHCSEATPQNFNCNSVKITIGGPGINYQSNNTTVNYPNPLPIELISFNGTKAENTVDLFWSTASERNNDYFTLENSTDGINFIQIDKIKGAGTTTELQEYSYLNTNLNSGLNYFRLSQTDYDGTIKRLEIIAFEREKSSSNYSVYPNPSNDRKINIDLNTVSKSPLNINIYSMQGQLLITKQIQSKEQLNQIELPLQGSQFILELTQDSQILGREKILSLY